MRCLALFATLLVWGLLPAQSVKKDRKKGDSLFAATRYADAIPYFEEALKSTPKDDELLRKMGTAYGHMGDLLKAEEYLRLAIRTNPKCAKCYFSMAQVNGARDNKKMAMIYLDTALTLDARDPELLVSVADAKNRLGEQFEAEILFNKAISLAPDSSRYYYFRAGFYRGWNSLFKALDDYTKAIELEPGMSRLRYSRGDFYIILGMFDEALVDLNRAIKIDDGEVDYYKSRGVVYTLKKEYSKAIQDYSTAIKLDKEDYELYKARAHCIFLTGDVDRSCEDLKAGYEIFKSGNKTKNQDGAAYFESGLNDYCDPDKALYYFQKGSALIRLGKFDEAVVMLNRGLEKFPGDILLQNHRGNALLAAGKYEDALLDYERVIAKEEEFKNEIIDKKFKFSKEKNVELLASAFAAEVYLNKAYALFASHQFHPAFEVIEKGMARIPQLKEYSATEFYNARAFMRSMVNDDEEPALADLAQAMVEDPNYSKTYINRASLILLHATSPSKRKFIMGPENQPIWSFPFKVWGEDFEQLEMALEDCNRAIEMEPNNRYYFYVRGAVKRAFNYADYCDDIRVAKQLGMDLPEYKWFGCK